LKKAKYLVTIENSVRCEHCEHPPGNAIENNSVCERDIHYNHTKSFDKQERNNKNSPQSNENNEQYKLYNNTIE
jgi:hypothetical protein